MDKKQLRLNEFCQAGDLSDFREVLENILEKIDRQGCRISIRDDGGPSVHEFVTSTSECHIRIPIKKFQERPVEAIWVILHEFGHHLSGNVEKVELANPDTRMKREALAWEFAGKEIQLYPKLAKLIYDFDNYKEQCLNNYREKLNIC